MTTTTKSPIDALVHHLQETALLSTSNNLLDWDQETQMPAGGLEWRARQQALIARMVHERLSSMERGDLIAAVESDKAAMADAQIAALVREARRDHVKATKLPASLVEEMAKTSSIAKHEWAEARAASDFKRFSPWLVKLVALLRVQADCYGFAAGGERWDALADLYEPGCTAKQVAEVFDPLRPRLQKLIGEIGAASRKPADGFNDYFVGIDKARFKKPVMPGDTLELHVEIKRFARGIWWFSAHATVDGQLATEAELMCTLRTIDSKTD